MARCIAVLLTALLLAVSAEGSDAPEANSIDPVDVVGRAFENRYAVDTRQILEVVVSNRFGESRSRRVAVATKHIRGRLHSLGRFLEPEYLRGTTILNIENRDRSDDHFLYMRSIARIRRVAMNHRAEAFMGTDLTYEDFERRRVEDYDLKALPPTQVEGEPVQVVEGRPHFDTAYDRIEFYIADSDAAILETRYFKRKADQPFKVVRAPRAHMRSFADHIMPTYLIVENLVRGTTTEVRSHKLAVNPELADSLFTASAIEIGRPIPGLE